MKQENAKLSKTIKIISALVLIVVLCLTGIVLLPRLLPQGEIIVYYTNDVHSYIANSLEDEIGLTYSKVAALKAAIVDAGYEIAE